MEQNDIVSLITPVYQSESVLPRFLRCVRKQRYRNLDVILVDDGSADRSAELCDRAASVDPRIRVLHKDHGGVAKARNAALDICTGRYIMFADADDLFCAQYVERLVDAVKTSGCRIAACPAFDTHDTGLESYECTEQGEIRFVEWGEENYLLRESHRVIWGTVFERSVLKDLRFDERYTISTDTLFFVQAFAREGRYAFLPEPLYCYIMYEQSLSHRKYDRIKYDDLLIWCSIVRMMPEGSESYRTSLMLLISKYKEMVRALKNGEDPELFSTVLQDLKTLREEPLLDERSVFALKARFFCRFPEFYAALADFWRKL